MGLWFEKYLFIPCTKAHKKVHIETTITCTTIQSKKGRKEVEKIG